LWYNEKNSIEQDLQRATTVAANPLLHLTRRTTKHEPLNRKTTPDDFRVENLPQLRLAAGAPTDPIYPPDIFPHSSVDTKQ
jgi:hypothetical protein